MLNTQENTLAVDNPFEELINRFDASDFQWMEDNWRNNREQVFTHSPEVGETLHVRVTALNKALEKGEIKPEWRMIALPDDLYQNIIRCQGIERAHLANITLDDAVYQPAIIIELPDYQHVIVDGNHKLVKSYEAGLRRHPAFFLKRAIIEPYLLVPPPRVAELMTLVTKENIQLQDAILLALKKRATIQ